MKTTHLSKLSLAIGLSIASTSALASPQSFMSARSFAMGGTGVAVAQPSAAPSANPAMLASEQHEWADDFGLMIPSINARLADEEEVLDQIEDIQDTIDALDQAISDNNQTQAQASAGELREQLKAFDKDTVRGNAGVGLALAFPGNRFSVGITADTSLTATARGNYDATDDATLASIENGTVPSNTNGYTLQSDGRVLASAISEVGLSIASSFDIANGRQLQVGVTPKYIQLQTFQYTETVSGFEDDDSDSDQYQTDKSGFNMDIGAAYAFGEENQWNTGIMVRNIIPMELDSAQSKPLQEKERTLELNPMVTAGIAHKSDYHVLTAEVDLTKKEAFGYEDDTQWLALGAELDAWRWAQLRAGVRHNLASNDDNDGIEEATQLTAGLGLNIWGVRVDIGGLYSDADTGAAIEIGSAF